MRSNWIFSVVLIFLLSGCMSKGFKRDEMFAQLNQKTEVTDRDIEEVFKLRPQLPKPFTLAVYLNIPRTRDSRFNETHWMWTDSEQQMISAAIEPLKQRHIVKDIVFIPPSMVDGGDLKSVRLAAARHGADAVLVVKGIVDVDAFTNNWAYTYVLLAPALFIPGNEARSLFISHASLWDVRNEFLYLTAEGDAESSQTRPGAFIDKEKLVADAQAASVKLLSQKLKDLSEHFDEPKTAAE